MNNMGLQVQHNKVYSNCSIYHPDGTLMCRCSLKKIKWYLKKGLATPINDTDIRLNFVPKGKGWANNDYYLEQREDRCVVCGVTDNLTKHHVVPYQYRKHMPFARKMHSHFDVLCVCVRCHDEYEEKAGNLNKTLAEKYGIDYHIPMSEEEKTLIKINSYLNAIKLHKEKIPQNRLDNMLIILSTHLKRTVQISDVDEIEISIPKKNNYAPGKKILDAWQKENNIQQFVVMWREHFIENTKPKYLSKFWEQEYKTRFF